MITNIIPLKGNIKGHNSQVFEMDVTSYNQPAILTIMLNVKYKLTIQNEKYEESLKNYNICKEKLEELFLINEHGTYKPVRIYN